MQEYHNKHYTIYDWFIILCVVAVFVCGYMGCKTYQLNNQNTLIGKLLSEKDKEYVDVEKRFDSVRIAAQMKIDSLHKSLAGLNKQKAKVIVKYKNIHDTITLTPLDSQIVITKQLCPGTGDSINLQEINYCLADGKESSEMLAIAEKELALKDGEIAVQNSLINEGLLNSDVKDAYINDLKEVNEKLNLSTQKEKRLKTVWRNSSIGLLGVLIAIIAL
jgi:hypothetical protein